MKLKKASLLISLIVLLTIILSISNSCMSIKRCPGVHRYTTQGGGGKESRHKGTGIANPNHDGKSKKKYSSARYGGATIKDSKLGAGSTLTYSGGILKDSRESSRSRGTGAWTKKNLNKDKHKAKSGIIPPHLKKPPKSKHKKSTSKKVVKDKFDQ